MGRCGEEEGGHLVGGQVGVKGLGGEGEGGEVGVRGEEWVMEGKTVVQRALMGKVLRRGV